MMKAIGVSSQISKVRLNTCYRRPISAVVDAFSSSVNLEGKVVKLNRSFARFLLVSHVRPLISTNDKRTTPKPYDETNTIG